VTNETLFFGDNVLFSVTYRVHTATKVSFRQVDNL